MNRSAVLILFLIQGISFYAQAQLDNRLFYDQYPVEMSDSGAIKFGVDISGYFWNNEYTTNITPGYTLFGYQFKPYFSYYPTKNLRLDLGGNFMKDFGDSSFSDIRPVLTLKYQKNHFSFLFGTIEGAATHRLIEPLYYLQNVVSKRIEDGLQFKWENERLFFDVWLEWVNMIYFGDDEREEFNLGISFNYQVYFSPHLRIEIPFQFLANHKGGEIDTNDLPAETLYNAALGFGLVIPFPHLNWLEHIRTDNYFVDYFTTETPAQLPYEKGDGLFLNLSTQFSWFNLTLSYWQGDSFIAPQGTPIYQSVSYRFTPGAYTEEQRKLFFLRCTYEHEFSGGLSLALRFEPVYDIGNERMDHMEMLYLRYKTEFFLNRRGKK